MILPVAVTGVFRPGPGGWRLLAVSSYRRDVAVLTEHAGSLPGDLASSRWSRRGPGFTKTWGPDRFFLPGTATTRSGDWVFIGLNSERFSSGLPEEGEQWDWLADVAEQVRGKSAMLFSHKRSSRKPSTGPADALLLARGAGAAPRRPVPWVPADAASGQAELVSQVSCDQFPVAADIYGQASPTSRQTSPMWQCRLAICPRGASRERGIHHQQRQHHQQRIPGQLVAWLPGVGIKLRRERTPPARPARINLGKTGAVW
jgi:hypothetical protein